ncbi:MAG: BamA/TamA family outer membrane protein [Armatimonadetes bacterium]|nr:BamA/TamA family outer membrane protein [Armatimonadota bacterium]
MGFRKISGVVLMVALAAAAFAQQAKVVSKITVNGNKEISEVAILAAMTLKVGSTFTEEARKSDQDKILDLGYFRDVKVLQWPSNDREIELKVEVSEYPVIKEIRVTGNLTIKTADIEKVVKDVQQMGKIWSSRSAAPIKDAVKSLYEKEGIFVEFELVGPQLESPGTLTIAILEPTIEQIRFKGLVRTKAETIKRMMKSKPGGTFNRELLRSDLYGLGATYWFEKIEPDVQLGERPGAYIVNINFEEGRTAQVNAGVALDPQSRIVGTLSYGDTNFKGRGQSVGVQLSQATVGGGPSGEFGFTNRFYDAKDTVMSVRVFSKVIYNFSGNGLFGGNSDEQTDQFDERRTGFQVSFSRPVGKSYRFNFGVQGRDARTIDLQTTGTQNYIQQDGTLFSLSLGGEYDTTRGGAEPYAGDNFRVTLEPGYSNITKVGGNVASFQDLVGSNTFLRTTVEFRKYWSKEPKAKVKKAGDPNADVDIKPRPVIAFRARYGNISGTVPFFEQLFVGGSDSLRGYTNQRFWGSQSFLATLEYRYPVQKNFSLAAFGDYGGAWGGYGELNGFDQSSKPNLHLGYGVGVVFRVQGLGGIRVDLAFNQEGGSRTHFSFGQSF